MATLDTRTTTPSPAPANPLTRAASKTPLVFIIPGAILLKLILAGLLWNSGYIEHDADGFTRSIRAYDWSRGLIKLEVDAWLPLQFWLNGTLMKVWADLIAVPRAVNLLCSLITLLNLTLIARKLFGTTASAITALLVAVFPWEIWFGLSGMSESLTHALLTTGALGFVGWLAGNPQSLRWLWLASGGFLGATMVRYEAWFYTAIYILLVLLLSWGNYRRQPGSFSGRKLAALALSLAPSAGFIIAWMWASWQDPRLQSPLGFARLTSEINRQIFGSANQNVDFLGRLIYYPNVFLNLFPPLSLLAIFGSCSLLFSAWQSRQSTAPGIKTGSAGTKAAGGVPARYLALVWGEFALFILTTLPFNNIAPGSARYPVSNLLLLLPVVGWLFASLLNQPVAALRRVAQGGAIAALLVLSASLIWITFSRAPSYPDTATRQTATWLKQRFNEGYLKPYEKVMLHLPAADGTNPTEFTRAWYALRVLTNSPDRFFTEADLATFTRTVQTTDGGAPHLWVHLAAAGGSPADFTLNYRSTLTFGDYTVAMHPLYLPAVPELVLAPAGATFNFAAYEFIPGEPVAVWVNRPDGKIIAVGDIFADTTGRAGSYFITPRDYPGEWAATFAGKTSGRRAITRFTATPVS